MKRLLTAFLVLLFAMGSVAKAGPVDEQTAKEIGAKYLSASVNLKTSVSDMQLVKTYFMGGGDAAFYVFNTAGSFVIVSAQDVATPILGYSDEGSFDVNDIPEQMEWWLQDYAKQIQYCFEENVVPFDKTIREWELIRETGKLSDERALTAVTPLLTSTWHQNWPYNKFCPEAANTSPDLNGHKYAGCVACAMSQVMRKWNYPETGYGEHTYNPSGSPQQSVNFGETTYQWANMPDNITNESPVEEIDAVATLMYHAGVAVDMYYAVSGSSCNDDSKVANAFKTYFLYSDELSLEELHSYTTSDYATWKVKLRSSLDHGFPIFYTAGDDNSPAGHAFVLDGYSNEGAFHINWGYSGAGNGYYPVGSFNTGGYHYNHAPCAIVNMHPQTQPNGDPWPTTQFQIAVSSNGNGTVSGGDNYDFGASVTVSATANSGYSFAYWKEEDVIVSTDKDYTFTAKYNRNLEAYFEAPGTITVLPNDAAYGTVSGGGTYAVNDNVSLSASANTGYIFENWTKDGIIVATENPYSFKANGTATYVANFMPYEGEYIGNESTNSSNGNVPSAVMYKHSISEQIYTKAEVGGSGDIYSIAFFNVGYTGNLNDVTRTLDIYMKNTDKAEFDGTSDSDWITANYDYLVFSGEVTFEYGTWTTIYLDTPFYYDGENNLVVIVNDCTGHTNTSHNFKTYYTGKYHSLYNRGSSSYNPANMSGITGSLRTTEKNKIIINKGTHTGNYSVTTTEIPEGAGTLTGAGSYAYDAECTVTATPGNESFVFRHWTKNGKIMSTNPTYTFTVKGNASMVAVFAGPGTVFTSVNPVGTGTVSGTGVYNYGTTCTLTATPADDYAFSKWTINGEVVSTDPTYAFTVTEDVSVVANFRSVDMIEFVDPQVKGICLEAGWDTDGDGEISMREAAAVTDIGVTFDNKLTITSFNELQYFTGITSIAQWAFRMNTELTSIIIPENVTSIGNSAFFYCNKLESVTIPNGVESIGTTAFKYCPALTSVTINRVAPATLADNETFAKNAEGDLIDGLTIKVPYGAVDTYKSATKWSKYSSQISAIENSYLFSSAGNWANGNFTSAAGTNAPNSASAIVFIDANCTIPVKTGGVTIGTLVVSSGKTLTVSNGEVLNVTKVDNTGTASRLVLNDGAQLIIPQNTGVKATLKKTTSASSAKATNAWYAIASPVNNIAISNFVQGTHNVYRYDEVESEWEEYRNSNNIYNNLENGRGYLYRSKTANVEFAGDVNTGKQTYPLTYTTTAGDLKGFHLIGNPYPHNIYKGAGTAIENTYVEDGFYKLKADGTWLASNDNSTAINVNEGILVQAKSTVNGQNLTILDKTSSVAKSGNDQIMFAVENADYSDVAYVLFKEGHGLNKVEHRNADIQMLYVINEDEKFGIADMPDDTKVINLGFEAKTIGQYTLGVKTEGIFKYLHLIDKLTGEDVDMLVDNNYSFMASPTDAPERFIVRLEYSTDPESSDSSFAYQNGDDIIVTGKGELQIFDVMGRLIMHKSINGVETCHGKSLQTGVYIFKLNEKTQKIFIK